MSDAEGESCSMSAQILRVRQAGSCKELFGFAALVRRCDGSAFSIMLNCGSNVGSTRTLLNAEGAYLLTVENGGDWQELFRKNAD